MKRSSLSKKCQHNACLLLLSLCCACLALRSGAEQFAVTTTADQGTGSLRQAILNANARAGADSIVFTLPVGRRHLFQPETPLPDILDAVILDGATQPGYAGFPLIELDGSGGETSTNSGLRIRASNCVVRALAINRCGVSGIWLEGSGNLVERCLLGTDFSGTQTLGNTYGLLVSNAGNTVIRDNVISGNAVGIWIGDNSTGIRVMGNRIGTDVSGNVALGNWQGVVLETVSNNIVEANLISGNQGTAVSIGADASGNQVLDNGIGLNNMMMPLPNGLDGVEVWDASNNLLRGNFIVTNTYRGIALQGSGTHSNRIESNTLLANVYGIELSGGAHENQIGGNTGEGGNLIAGNIADGIVVRGLETRANRIENNEIQANAQAGIRAGASTLLIQDNHIRENTQDGVWIGALDGLNWPEKVSLRKNSFAGNGDMGIRLQSQGTFAANHGQPAPILSLAVSDSAATTLIGTLTAAPNSTYVLDFFSSPEPDPSGYGEGELYLGSLSVQTSSVGSAVFTTILPPVREQYAIAATATSADGDTSAFSRAVIVGLPGEVPLIRSLSPDNATMSGAEFTLTVRGERFVSRSEVQWNGVELVTTFVSATELRARVPASFISNVGPVQVAVVTAPPGGGASNPLPFLINNPIPQISSLSPDSVVQGNGPFVLRIRGNNFVPTSEVRWNGQKRTTRYLSKTEIEADITVQDVVVSGAATVSVFNPSPVGGLSNEATFTTKNPVPTLIGLTPSSVTAGSSGILVELTGSRIVTGAQAYWNGSARETSFVKSQVFMKLMREDLATPSVNPNDFVITLRNPAPGGGVSNALPFSVLGAPQLVIASAIATRLTNSVQVTFTLQNIGKGALSGGRLAAAKLGGIATTASLPANLPNSGNLAAGATSSSITISIPSSVLAGSRVLTITVTAGSRSLAASRLVVVP